MCKYKQLKKTQRICLEILLKEGKSKKEIALKMGVHRSTVYRELNRNKNKRGNYTAHLAQEYAKEQRERFTYPRKFTEEMKRFIRSKLEDEWSPEQIAGYCNRNQIDMVSHETIYQFIYQDKKQGGSLFKKLRIASKPYRKRYGSYARRGKIPNRVSIEQRPELVNLKQRIGDWEADTIVGKNHQGSVLTLVERKTYFTLLGKLDKPLSASTCHKMINLLAPFKEQLYSITADNGSEFARHQKIAEKLSAEFYFTHPYSAWEKAINENTNGLIRQYLPKSSNLNEVNTDMLKLIEEKLNNRPRKSLGFKTPLQVFMQSLTQTKSVALGT